MTAFQIQSEVAHKHGLDRHRMIVGPKTPDLVMARAEAMFRCRTELEMSYPAIGRVFCKHHTSARDAVISHQRRNSN